MGGPKGRGTIAAPAELSLVKARASAPRQVPVAFQLAPQQDWIAPMLRIPHNGFVFVGDGIKALVLRNEGDAQILNLKTERVFTDAIRRPTSKGRIVRAGPSRQSARVAPA